MADDDHTSTDPKRSVETTTIPARMLFIIGCADDPDLVIFPDELPGDPAAVFYPSVF
jgi:hypothetical protein